MKKNIFLRQNRFYICLWICFHAFVFLGFLSSLFFGQGLNVESNLFSMMPSSLSAKELQAADSLLSERTGNNFFIFAGNADFYKAKDAAMEACQSLSSYDEFSFVEVNASSFSSDEIASFVHKWRFNLLPKATSDEIKSSDDAVASFGDDALAKIYGAFSIAPLQNMDSDPFMLDDIILRGYLSLVSSSDSLLSPKEGVLAAELDGTWYVAIRACMSKKGSALGGRRNGVPIVYSECLSLEKDGTRFVFSGTPFHSYKSSLSASKEISVIGIVSMTAVVLILLLVFKSFLPMVLSVFAVAVSCAAAFCATRLLLGKVHLVALVFGTSLIGSCIDYSLHFFIHWKSDLSLQSGSEIRRKIFTGLALSLASTEICYLLLFFAPFELLRQVAVFSFAGIMSSFLTSLCLFPCLRLPKKRVALAFPKFKLDKRIRYCLLLLFFAFASIVIFAMRKNVGIKNDISSLYKMEGRLKDDTILSAKLTGQSAPAWFLVSGDDADSVLQTEELLSLQEGKAFSGTICTSLFAPSKKTQDESRAASEILLDGLEEQLLNIGFDDEDSLRQNSLAIKKEFDDSRASYVLPDDLPQAFLSLTENLWLGKIGGKYYSLFMPRKILSKEECRSLAEKIPGLTFMNKAEDISKGLDQLSEFIAKTFLLAFVLIVLMLKFFYSWKQVLKIVLVPLASLLSILAVFALLATRIEFFCMTGTVLVFGLGLDYVIYMAENSKRKKSQPLLQAEEGLEPLAILLSFVTTAISFGALAFSSFVPVHIIGLTVFAGLSAAFACTFLER